MEYIDVLIEIPVKFRHRAYSPADLSDAFNKAETEVEEIIEEFQKFLAQHYPDTVVVDADTMTVDYDENTYDPYPQENPYQPIIDMGEWRDAS